MQLDRQAKAPRRLENARDLVGREGDGLAEAVDRVDQAFGGERRQHLVDDEFDIGRRDRSQNSGGSACAPRKVVRDRNVALVGEPPRGAQHLALGGEVEAVAGLDLDRRRRPRRSARRAAAATGDELVLARRARRRHRRDDAAAGARDLLIARAVEPQLEFLRAIAGVDEMGVAIDQRRG